MANQVIVDTVKYIEMVFNSTEPRSPLRTYAHFLSSTNGYISIMQECFAITFHLQDLSFYDSSQPLIPVFIDIHLLQGTHAVLAPHHKDVLESINTRLNSSCIAVVVDLDANFVHFRTTNYISTDANTLKEMMAILMPIARTVAEILCQDKRDRLQLDEILKSAVNTHFSLS